MEEKHDLPRNADIEILAAGASISFVGKIAGRVVFAVSQIVLARFLGPELFGLYSLGWAALRLVGTIAPLGLTGGIIRYGSRYVHRDKGRLKDIISRSLNPSVFFSVIAALLVYVFAPQLEALFMSPGLAAVLRGFAFAIPLFVITRVLLSATQIWQQMQYTVVSEDLGQPIADLIMIVGVIYLLNGGLLESVTAAVLSWAFALVLAAYFALRLFPDYFSVVREKSVSYSELLLFSLPTAFAGTFTFLTSWIDRILLGLYATTVDVGVYQALAQPALIITIILRSLNSIFTPMIASLYESGELERLKELYRVTTKWGIYLSFPIFLFICFASQDIMVSLFGIEYASGSLPLVILTVGQMVNVSTGAVGFILIMTGYERVWLLLSALSFTLNILLNLVLISRLGMVGAAVATACAISVLYIGGMLFINRKLGLWPYDGRYKKGIIAALTTVLAMNLVQLIPIQNDWVSMIVLGTLSVVVFAGVLLVLGLDSEDREFLSLLVRKSKVVRG